MTRPLEVRPALSEGIDRQVLHQVRERFLAVNKGRLQRAMEGLLPAQQTILKLLALLFHVNDPLLPGYVSDCTPAGVSGYAPDAPTLTAAQALAADFIYRPQPGQPQAIHGLYLMGSLGTLAQTDQSDMDVWLCHAPGLDDQALANLRKKCRRLETWAAGQGSEAHFFLIDAQRFAQGERALQCDVDDFVNAQHSLLLDEFYRTAIWLVGRTPLWWWVPAYEEARYGEFIQTLEAQRLIPVDEVIDLGHLAHIPAAEFLGAGLKQLFKGIESPYKSVLKLLLIEVYASEHPRVSCLSLGYKRAVYAHQLDLDELDPYVMVYRRIEGYLQARGDVQRLELVRRSLYLKVNHKLSGHAPAQGAPWQRALLERLTHEWGWDEQQLAQLDNRSKWKTGPDSRERLALSREFNDSYRFLSQLARHEYPIRLPVITV